MWGNFVPHGQGLELNGPPRHKPMVLMCQQLQVRPQALGSVLCTFFSQHRRQLQPGTLHGNRLPCSRNQLPCSHGRLSLYAVSICLQPEATVDLVG